jgi:signal transduction histidine kinase
MGMVLSICPSIIDAHGGRIWASSPGGTGAVSQFALPSIRESPAEPKSVVPT